MVSYFLLTGMVKVGFIGSSSFLGIFGNSASISEGSFVALFNTYLFGQMLPPNCKRFAQLIQSARILNRTVFTLLEIGDGRLMFYVSPLMI